MLSFVGPVLAAVVVLSVVGSIAVVRWLQEPPRGWYEVASARLVYGVPWGTLIVLSIVLAVYLFVQDGVTDPSNPVSLPFRSWSYFSPLGMALGSFAHASFGHLLGNVAGALVVAPIAEYAWGHYPQTRSGDDSSTRSGLGGALETAWVTPWVRAAVIFPLAVVVIGLVTSLFSLGPVIGFSGLVYAFAGFAIVRYPITTLLATTLLQSAVLTTYRALQTPVLVYVAEASPPSPPSWATIAIQGHALGFFLGLVCGLLVLERRSVRPDPLHVWLAILLFAISKGLWQIYWFGEGNTFLRFQGPGLAIVAILALVITLAIVASSRPLLPPGLDGRLRRTLERLPGNEAGRTTDPPSPLERPLELAQSADLGSARSAVRLDRVTSLAAGGRTDDRPPLSPSTRRGAAFFVVLFVVAILAGMAVPTNLFVLAEPTHDPETAIEIEGYAVEYAESTDNQLVSGIGIEAIESDEGLEASGVIVSSADRNLWLEEVSSDQLAFSGNESITVGGPGWRETVYAERTGWDVVGNETVYNVHLSGPDDERLAFESGGAVADPQVAGQRLAVVPQDGDFYVGAGDSVEEGLEGAPVPAANESVDVGNVTVERDADGETLYAVADGTRVAIANEETYRG
ncbi:rhomboid family intramembrane serine protease [Natrarchaeobaculum aegyptiacum]|uniref:Protease n=1 Tax=Natrarchaeobaculum aegyptiacum TaxID=745377 RepID=A0A2Z2HWB1_9EURY|nr:rhomboid family intramembrane serine protease [Natrarchaeobaculum aegyptiacum]ARS91551.1 protease [Natrarchaeobaculum aegyptiacum]